MSVQLTVRGLPLRATEDDVRTFFRSDASSEEPFIAIRAVELVQDSEGKPTGDGTVEVATEADCEKALTLNGEKMGNRRLEVLRAEDVVLPPPGDGNGTQREAERRDRDRDRGRDRHRDRDKERDKDRGREHRDRDGDRKDKDRYGEKHKDRSRERGRRSRSRSRSRSRDREQRRSKSPPRKKEKKKSNWDAPPDPNNLAAATMPANHHLSYKARRVYVGNLPQNPQIDDAQLKEFFDAAMTQANLTEEPGSAVRDVWMNDGKAFAFVEVRTVQEATNAMTLDGITLFGCPLRVKRPSDYVPPTVPSAAALAPFAPSISQPASAPALPAALPTGTPAVMPAVTALPAPGASSAAATSQPLPPSLPAPLPAPPAPAAGGMAGLPPGMLSMPGLGVGGLPGLPGGLPPGLNLAALQALPPGLAAGLAGGGLAGAGLGGGGAGALGLGVGGAGATPAGLAALNNAAALMQLTKKQRKLHVGSLQPNMGLTPEALRAFVCGVMQQLSLTVKPGDPVADCFVATEGKYAFVEFRTVQEATNALSLTGVELFGRPVKIGRPTDYVPLTPETISKCEGTGILGSPGDLGVDPPPKASGPDLNQATTVVVIKNMLSVAELESDQECKEIAEDTVEKCEADFGKVKGIVIARPGKSGVTESLLGKVFVEFEEIAAAKKAATELHHVKFDDRVVETSFEMVMAYNALKRLYPEQG